MARTGAKTRAKTGVGVRTQKLEVLKTCEEDYGGLDTAAELKPSEGDMDPSLLVTRGSRADHRTFPREYSHSAGRFSRHFFTLAAVTRCIT